MLISIIVFVIIYNHNRIIADNTSSSISNVDLGTCCSQGVGPPYSWRKIWENERKSAKHHLVTTVNSLNFVLG